jgi:hypothetical protein
MGIREPVDSKPEVISGGATNIDILRETLAKLNLETKPKKKYIKF